MTQIAIRDVTHTTHASSTNPTNNLPDIGTVLPGRENNAADMATIRLLNEVTALRRQLRALEPELSAAITTFGWRRGWSGYREFHLTSRLEEK